jgi:hypothetical protein
MCERGLAERYSDERGVKGGRSDRKVGLRREREREERGEKGNKGVGEEKGNGGMGEA